MSYSMLSVITNDQMGYPSCWTMYLHLIIGFYRQSYVHGIPDTQEIPMRDYDDIFYIDCHHFLKKRPKTVPDVSYALCVRKQSVINGLLRMFDVLTKPLDGFAAALPEVSFSKFLPEDRFCSQMPCDCLCRLFCALQV